jgi:hypothetical protein
MWSMTVPFLMGVTLTSRIYISPFPRMSDKSAIRTGTP